MVPPLYLPILMLLVLCDIVISSDDPIVETSLGAIRGIIKSSESIKIRVFLGVPYAVPPVGSLRFTVPTIATTPWRGELKAQKLGSTCYQTPDESYPGFNGSEMWNPPTELSEDCLNLNIWAPEKPNGNVLVWIYGGGFYSGSPSLSIYDGTALAAHTGAIVVNINYRVGPFGFLFLGPDSAAPGNMGLLDQQTALKWINQHISSFGGDPQKVTLIGESAGAASVTSHLTAPDSYPYFNKIIANSGSIIHPWATRTADDMTRTTMKFLTALNCLNYDMDLAHKCLTGVSAEDILLQSAAMEEWGEVLSFPFVPVRSDKNFFKGDVYERLEKGDMKKDVSVIIGAVKDEGTFWLPYYFSETGFAFDPTKDPNSPANAARLNESQYVASIGLLMPRFLNSKSAQQILVDKFKTFSKEEDYGLRLRDGVGRLVGDMFFACSVKEYTETLLKHIDGPVFSYYFAQRSSANPWPKWMGVMHGYEIEYEFGQPFNQPSQYDPSQLDKEQKVSKYVMDLIKQFMDEGRPAPFWPKYQLTRRRSHLINEATASGQHLLVESFHASSCSALKEAERASKPWL